MKNLFFILLLCLLPSCSGNDDSLIGVWQSDNGFYRATYKIMGKGSKLKGLVLYYNDDTTVYKYDETKEHYIFEGLKQKGRMYTDATAGATKGMPGQGPIRIELLHKDTLRVTTYVMNKPLKEFWTRKNTR